MSRLWYDDTPDPLPCRLPDDLVAKCAEVRAEKRERSRAADAAVMEQFASTADVAARTLLDVLVDNAAARIKRWPSMLFDIPGLAPWSPPEQIIAVCDSMRETAIRRFGDEVEPINRAGARRYAERLLASERAALTAAE